MSAMAEVIDESIRNMTSNMVTKADQEKVSARPLKLDMDLNSYSGRIPRISSINTLSKSTLRSLNPSFSLSRRTTSLL